MKMIPVDSTAIQSVGYDENARVLYVEFDSRKVYKYFDVDASVYGELRSAASVGKYFEREIRKKGYRFEEVR